MERTMRTFYIIILTQTFSIIGSQMSGLAIGIWVYQQTGNATPLTLVALFGLLPNVLLASVAGVLADRYDRRYIMALSDFGQALCTLLLLMSFLSGQFELWHLYLISLLKSAFGVFQGPAFSSSITMLVDDAQRTRANAITQMTQPLAGIIAPALTGVVYAIGGIAGAILVDIITFLVSVGVILSVHIPRPSKTEAGKKVGESAWKQVTAGFRYLWQRKPLLGLMLYISCLNFLLAGTSTLFTPFLLGRLNNETQYGIIMSLGSLGAIVGGIVIGAWGGTKVRMRTVMPSIVVVGVALACLGISSGFWGFSIFSFFIMFPLPFINALFMSIMQVKVAPDLQGRVFSALDQMAMLLMPLSYLLAGPLADQVFEPATQQPFWNVFSPIVGDGKGAGIGLLLVIVGAMTVGISLVVWLVPNIRNLERILPDYSAKPQDNLMSVGAD